jgi:hypothetical protein
MSEFKDEDVRNAANSIKTLREKRESLVESIAEIDKLLGVQDAQGVDGLIAMYHKYKPLLEGGACRCWRWWLCLRPENP